MSVEVDMNFDGFQKEFEREIRNLVWGSTMAFRDAITLLLTTTGKSSKKAPHNYSVAGQVPHNLSGDLGRSWKTTKPQREGNKYSSNVFTNIEYAAALQFGSAQNNLAARPYIKKSIEKAMPRIRKLINAKAMVARAAARSGV